MSIKLHHTWIYDGMVAVETAAIYLFDSIAHASLRVAVEIAAIYLLSVITFASMRVAVEMAAIY